MQPMNAFAAEAFQVLALDEVNERTRSNEKRRTK